MRKTIYMGRIMMAVVILLAIFAVFPQSGYAADAQVVFIATEPDSDGYFTVTMNVKNAEFNVFQMALKYDIGKIQPVNSATKAPATIFNSFGKLTEAAGFLSTVGTSLDSSAGFFGFTAFVMPGTENSLINSAGAVVCGADGLDVFRFSFRQIAKGDFGLEIATKAKGEPYEAALPQGAGLGGRSGNIPATIVFEIPASLGSSSEEQLLTRDEATEDDPDASDNEQGNNISNRAERINNTVILQIDNYAAAISGQLHHIYPGEKAVIPYIRNSRTYVPLRFIAESMGGQVEWQAASRTVVIVREEKTIRMTVGNNGFTVNDTVFEMDAAAEITSGRTMVPIRFVAEAFNQSVTWDAVNRLVIVAPKTAPWDNNGTLEQQILPDLLLMVSPLMRDFV